jgi:hypothetical protein
MKQGLITKIVPMADLAIKISLAVRDDEPTQEFAIFPVVDHCGHWEVADDRVTGEYESPDDAFEAILDIFKEG